MPPERLAEWLIVGFKRGWKLRDVYVASGLSDVPCEVVHERYQFMPPDNFSISRPVRAFFAAEWPKLNTFLCNHEGDAQKMLSVVPQLVRLVAKGKRGEVRGPRDILDMRKERKTSRAVSTSYGISRDAFKTHQRSAWSVCK